MNQLTESDLIAECKKGNQRAFNEIVRRYQEKLYWLVRRMVGNHDDADDIVQDVFVKVWQGIGNFREEAGLYTWIYRIGTNLSLNFLRRRKIRSFLSLDDMENILEAEEERPHEHLEAMERRTLIEKAIQTLPDKQRMVFVLRYYHEMPYEEMAVLLHKSTGGLKANYFHAVKKIEGYLKHAL